MRTLRETASCANVDGDRGLGLAVIPRGMEMAIEKARNTGVGMVTLGNCHHSGMVAYHAMMALEHDMIGVCCSASSGAVVPTFASKAIIGTNPLAVAAPAGIEAPFVFDAATSAVAGNKIVLAKRMGANLSPGWVSTADGTPIMEEAPVPDEYMLLPLGGTRELGSHKGYSLAMVVDILGAVLSGHPAGPMNPSVHNQHHFVAAYLIDAFVDVADFKRDMDEYLGALRNLEPAPGHDRVIYAGLPEAEAEADRRANGIPLHPEVVEWLRDMCAEMEIPCGL
jgi:LDH2 family malate/lactate/ureidoglycolate dehydrogenase